MISCSCAWRLIADNVIITGWTEPDYIGGPLNKNLLNLLDDKIECYDLSLFNDIRFIFESGKILEVFCDITPASEFGDFNCRAKTQLVFRHI